MLLALYSPLNYLKQLMTASTSDKEKNYMNGRKRIYKTPLITSILTIFILEKDRSQIRLSNSANDAPAALVYQLTRNPLYLKDAQNIAKECYNYFFTDFTTTTGESFKMLKQGDIWFTAVMLRGFHRTLSYR